MKHAASVLATIVLGAGILSGCASPRTSSPGTAKKKTLVVFAAASLTETFTRLGQIFEASHHGVSVTFNFGGSDTLAQQIDQGAPADVFAAASLATMRQVTSSGNAAAAPQTFAKNRLEIAVPTNNPGRVSGLKDLANPTLKVVLCAPQVPCGAAAIKALAAGHLTVKPVSQEQNVKSALTKIELNEADAALVYRTDVRSASGKVTGIDFPEADRAITTYPIVTLAKTPQPALAQQFTRLVLDAQGMSVLTQAGFEKP